MDGRSTVQNNDDGGSAEVRDRCANPETVAAKRRHLLSRATIHHGGARRTFQMRVRGLAERSGRRRPTHSNMPSDDGNERYPAMSRGRWLAIAVCGCAAIASCGPSEASLIAAANRFSQAADRCLLDVRDQRIAYGRSAHCRSLRQLSLSYLTLGGESEGPSLLAAARMEAGRATAWSALAFSASRGRVTSLWDYDLLE